MIKLLFEDQWREHHSSFTLSLMNMYTQLSLLTFLANPDQTGEVHTWKPFTTELAAPSRGWRRVTGVRRMGWCHVVSPSIALRSIWSSWRVTSITPCLLNANKHSAGNKLFMPALFTKRFILHQFIAEHSSQHLSWAAWNWRLVMMSML